MHSCALIQSDLKSQLLTFPKPNRTIATIRNSWHQKPWNVPSAQPLHDEFRQVICSHCRHNLTWNTTRWATDKQILKIWMKNKAFTSSTCREAARRPHSPHKQAQNNVEEVALRGTASKFVSHTSSNPLILSHQKFLRLKLTLATPYSESRSAPQSKKNPATIMSQMPIFNMHEETGEMTQWGKSQKPVQST